MSWIDDRLQDLGNNETIPRVYDSIVRKLPVSDGAKEKVVTGGHTVGDAVVTGLRKGAQIAESAVRAAAASAREPLPDPAPPAGEPPAPAAPVNQEFLSALERLAALRAEGSLSHEEFEVAKAKLLRGED